MLGINAELLNNQLNTIKQAYLCGTLLSCISSFLSGFELASVALLCLPRLFTNVVLKVLFIQQCVHLDFERN